MGETRNIGYKLSMDVTGEEKCHIELGFEQTTMRTVLLQQRAVLKAQLELVELQLEGKI